MKSLQLVLNEWSDSLDYRVTASALSQARQKFSHTAFIELLEECVVKVMYSDDDYTTYKGHRLLAVDGSTLRLPRSRESMEYFGTVKYMNGQKQTARNQVEAKMSVLYDVLNEILLSAKIHPGRTNDIKACEEQLSELRENDIIMADRGYNSYRLFAQIVEEKADYIVRYRDNSYARSHGLWNNNRLRESTTIVSKPHPFKNDLDIPEFLKIRFIKIKLQDGEVERQQLLCLIRKNILIVI